VPDGLLRPRASWPDKAAYDAQARKLAAMFHDNFGKYADDVPESIKTAGPTC
jgi:phosphoenolpyruvate carboxykinase (ATP)